MSKNGPEDHKSEIWPSFELPPINLWNAPNTQPGVVDNPLYELNGIPVWNELTTSEKPVQSSNIEPRSPRIDP